jgi:transketolase
MKEEEDVSYHSEKLIKELNEIAHQLRLDALEMIHRRGQGHPGGALSAAEIITALFFHHMRINPGSPNWAERDRFILSKGHACAVYYPALALRGYFPLQELHKWGNLGSLLQGHPDRLKTPGVDMTTGVLGHGLSIGTGLGLAARLKGLTYHTYVLLGDGGFLNHLEEGLLRAFPFGHKEGNIASFPQFWNQKVDRT